MSSLGVPVVVDVRDATVIDETYLGIDTADTGFGTARECVSPHDPAEGVLASEIVVQRQELPLLILGHCFELSGHGVVEWMWWHTLNSE